VGSSLLSVPLVDGSLLAPNLISYLVFLVYRLEGTLVHSCFLFLDAALIRLPSYASHSHPKIRTLGILPSLVA
jgi:hypothetical protein